MVSINRRTNGDKNKLKEEILNAKELAQVVANESKSLYDEEKIDGEDLHKILLAVSNLFEYLNTRYGDNKELNNEVLKMTETLYNPEVAKKADIKRAFKDAENFLRLEVVSQGTGISIERLRRKVKFYYKEKYMYYISTHPEQRYEQMELKIE